MNAPSVTPVVTRAEDLPDHAHHADGVVRMSGVGPKHTPANKLWFGEVTNEGGFRSVPHHHGDAETGGYVLRGHARIYYGQDYTEQVDLHAGDFLFVPPNMPHVEANMSVDEQLVWLTARTPDNTVVELPDVSDESLAGYRRA